MSTEASLKKKIHMIAAIIGALKLTKVRGTPEVEALEATITSAKTAFEENRIEDAETLGKKAGEELKACGKLLPKIRRKVVMIQIEKICRY